MIDATARSDYFRRALRERGLDESAVIDEVSYAIGVIHLVVASGSLVQGYGNAQSDIDVQVITDSDAVSQLPILSFRESGAIDIVHIRDADVLRRLAVTHARWPGAVADRASHRSRLTAIDSTLRIASALPLRGSDEWLTWWESLPQRDLGRVYAEDSWNEALRRWIAASWLADHRPAVAALRRQQALLISLNGLAAARGELYPPLKWLPEKLARVGPEYLEDVREALRIGPGSEGDEDWCRSVMTTANGRWRELDHLEVQLWLGHGVDTFELDGCALLSRYGLRGVEVRPSDGIDMSSQPVWRGAWHAASGRVRELYASGLLWLGVADVRP